MKFRKPMKDEERLRVKKDDYRLGLVDPTMAFAGKRR
jgi:hypothetical protein